ncbi:MAG TPA: MerR family transcriptional regulator [Saprospiraceae bacterium]|nr:MerR family transcriptional regulator [Saprospiraceae bacterium]HMP14168.1 MerR family transcriptional regulator [Saprospiraceae bacterium]
MHDEQEEQLKRYYSISEVADMFGVSRSLIRFWENEFEILKPHKNSKGDRRFTPQNIEQLQLIYHLVKERGFTLSGAKQEIQDRRQREKERQQIIKTLEKVREGLLNLRQLLDRHARKDASTD